jgi:hypothetical protein
MTESIPEQAVEAAARAQVIYEAMGDGPQWEDLTDHERARRLRGAFLSLEAAAPFVRAAYSWDSAKPERPAK